jgi:ADP-heptose:LPS heptosyltransferase
MSFPFLRILDRWIGNVCLYLLALPARLISFVLSVFTKPYSKHVFVKLKGGGSLIIAMPTLLGLRRHYPERKFILVCAKEAKVYAELTGIFDEYVLIDDTSFLSLIVSGFKALKTSFHASQCIDLEPNSLLAALFTMLSCADQRIGFVKPEEPARHNAYTVALSLNALSPIYIYYDRLCELLGTKAANDVDCRQFVQARLPTPNEKGSEKTIAIAAFTSEFARERMMPDETWATLLKNAYGAIPFNIMILGAERNKPNADKLAETLKARLPSAQVIVLAGFGTLAQSVSLFTLCDEVWAVDSGLLHTARLLGVPTRSFWGPTMPSQRLRPIEGLIEHVSYRPFLCSPCIQASNAPPCGGQNLCMISMADPSPDLHPAWVKRL